MTVLPTFSELPIASSLAKAQSGLPPEQRVQAAREKVGLGEITGRMLLHVRGNDAEIALQQPDMKIGDVVGLPGEEMLVRLRRDEFLLLAKDGRGALARLENAIGDHHVTLTDITHGRCVLFLVGLVPQQDENDGRSTLRPYKNTHQLNLARVLDAKSVLRKVCGLDFADSAFPNLHAAQTSLAKVRALIIRADINETTPAYGLIVDRSLAAYVWDVVLDATREFGGIALSSSGMDHLRKASLW